MHKTAKLLNYLPRSVQPKAKAALQAIWTTEIREQAPLFRDNCRLPVTISLWGW